MGGQAREWAESGAPSLQVPEPALLLIRSVTLGMFHNLPGPGKLHLQNEGGR